MTNARNFILIFLLSLVLAGCSESGGDLIDEAKFNKDVQEKCFKHSGVRGVAGDDYALYITCNDGFVAVE